MTELTLEEKRAICKTCNNRRVDVNEGLLCDLTSAPPAFAIECPDYDQQIGSSYTPIVGSSETADGAVIRLTEEQMEALKTEQNFGLAIAAGLSAAVVAAVAWAAITMTTNYQSGFMALGAGALVGFAVRMGKGIDQKFGILGATLALAACILGNVFYIIAYLADITETGYLTAAGILNFDGYVEALGEMFSGMDFVFYAIAIYEGYRFAFRKLTTTEVPVQA